MIGATAARWRGRGFRALTEEQEVGRSPRVREVWPRRRNATTACRYLTGLTSTYPIRPTRSKTGNRGPLSETARHGVLEKGTRWPHVVQADEGRLRNRCRSRSRGWAMALDRPQRPRWAIDASSHSPRGREHLQGNRTSSNQSRLIPVVSWNDSASAATRVLA